MSRPTIFLDDGGVMNNNSLRASQWQRLVSEFFAPLLGGTPEAWIDANRVVVDRMLEPESWRRRIQSATDFASFDGADKYDWLAGMCELVGIPTSPEDEVIALARRAISFIIPRVHAAFPGAVDAIRSLSHQGYTLHTASGEPSIDLAGYLDEMGVRACFGRLYGPDLIDTFKVGPRYYERIFADAGIAPADALVVDDNPGPLAWAGQVGARTILVTNSPYPATGTTRHIGSLAELPAILQK